MTYFNGERLKDPIPENGSISKQLEALGVSSEEQHRIIQDVFREDMICCEEFNSLMDVVEPIIDYGTKEMLG